MSFEDLKIWRAENPGVNPEFVEKVKINSWHHRDLLKPLLEWLLSLSQKESYEWSWGRNHRAKYIKINIDMRDGHFTIIDKDGCRISPEEIGWQYATKRELDAAKGGG